MKRFVLPKVAVTVDAVTVDAVAVVVVVTAVVSATAFLALIGEKMHCQN